MGYENKTNEELIELLEQRDEELEEYEMKVGDIECERDSAYDDLSVLHELEDFDKESFAEKAFDRGVEAGQNFKHDKTKIMKAWLNYKIEARL